MSLNKVNYVNNQTIINADNLNSIQDEIIANANKIARNNEAIKKGTPRNLLDNSDFTNLVNQRGETTYLYEFGYSIDRWRLYGGGNVSQVVVGDGSITVSLYNNKAYFDQLVDADSSKTYTFALMADDGLHLVSGIPNIGVNDGIISIDVNSSGYIRCGLIDYLKQYTLYWAVLYEGEYTLETLPEYQPKGYGAELVECMRYYQKFGQQLCLLLNGGSSGRYYYRHNLNFYIPMRIIPTIIIKQSSQSNYVTPDYTETTVNSTILHSNTSSSISIVHTDGVEATADL